MTLADFRSSVSADMPPDGVPALLRALWYDAKGDWAAAHALAQDVDNADGAWVHAYLHRKEGDDSNAAYWYRRAGKPIASGELDDEWARIADEILARTRQDRRGPGTQSQ
jgi:hypothetical protein